MKKIVSEFFRRGLAACGFGPLVLAVIYLVLKDQIDLQTVSVDEVCMGIFSLSLLAFVAGAMNVVYQIERLPLMVAILIHGLVLYAGYLVTYLVNGGLERGVIPLLVFTAIFVIGYLVIWLLVHFVVTRNTKRLNCAFWKKQDRI